MTELTIELSDEAAGRLRRRADREGVDPKTLAARILTQAAAEPDPLDFIGSFEADTLSARDADRFLADNGFGGT